ncbi:MAG: hypothetical protein ACJAT1_000827 [Marivirga sp.]|jgi:hypothetical protein
MKRQLVKNMQKAWKHLVRAHIIAQCYPLEHTPTHRKMLLFGLKIKSIKEIMGQIPRLLFGGLRSFLGIVPLGNTGGANVPALKLRPVPLDLHQILKYR